MDVFYYMWNFKPGEPELEPFMKPIERNTQYCKEYRILRPSDIEPLVDAYSSELRTLWNRIPHWIIKADLGRLLYIYYNGGYYFDVDCIIRKPFVRDDGLVLFTEHIVSSVGKLGPRESKDPANVVRIANFAFGTHKKEHPFLRRVIDECIVRLRFLLNLNQVTFPHSDILWVCGPDVMTTVYHTSKQQHTDVSLLDTSYLQHFCFGSWR